MSKFPTVFKKMNNGLRELGHLWAQSNQRPTISKTTGYKWIDLLADWTADFDMPLLVRHPVSTKGSEIVHAGKRKLIPCDNSPVHWMWYLAVRDIVPSLEEIREAFTDDTIPIMFDSRVDKQELEYRKYHCVLNHFNLNKDGWKPYHITSPMVSKRMPLKHVDILALYRAFANLMNPTNSFLLPTQMSGLGDVRAFVEGFAISEAEEELPGIAVENTALGKTS